MSNPIIPRTNSAPGAGAPASLLLGEIATNRSTGKMYLGADSGVVEIQGAGGATSFAELSGTLETQQLCALSGDVTATAGTASLQISALQGNPVSAASPSNGQVLQWNGSNWVAGTVSGGGSGGGGLLYYLNYTTAADAPTTGLPTTPVVPHQLGRSAEISQSSVTSGNLTVGQYNLVCGFVSESSPIDPDVSYWPAGIWDFNVWCTGNANAGAPTVLQLRLYKYDGTSPTLIATSGDAVVANNGTPVQTAISLVIPQTDVELTDRVYIEVRAKATGSNHTVTVSFGDSTPSHVHSTIPSVGGSGLVKVIDGTFQSPASLLLNADVDANAAISQSKISNLTTDLSARPTNAMAIGYAIALG